MISNKKVTEEIFHHRTTARLDLGGDYRSLLRVVVDVNALHSTLY